MTPNEEREQAKAEARERREARDTEYRAFLGLDANAPYPRTLGKAENMGRPPFVHRGLGERHAINPLKMKEEGLA